MSFPVLQIKMTHPLKMNLQKNVLSVLLNYLTCHLHRKNKSLHGPLRHQGVHLQGFALFDLLVIKQIVFVN